MTDSTLPRSEPDERHTRTPELVSVVMPVYNGARFLAEAIESIEAQTYPHFEICIANDGSTDGSEAIALAYPKVRYVYQENQGCAAARNRALELAAGEWIAFLDHDDIWAPTKLERQVEYLTAHPEIALSLTYERLFFTEGYSSEAWARHKLIEGDHIGQVPGVWMTRREIVDEIGPFDTKYRITDDADWLLRMLDAGYHYGVVDETLLFKRLHGGNISDVMENATIEILTTFRASIHRRRAEAQSAASR